MAIPPLKVEFGIYLWGDVEPSWTSERAPAQPCWAASVVRATAGEAAQDERGTGCYIQQPSPSSSSCTEIDRTPIHSHPPACVSRTTRLHTIVVTIVVIVIILVNVTTSSILLEYATAINIQSHLVKPICIWRACISKSELGLVIYTRKLFTSGV